MRISFRPRKSSAQQYAELPHWIHTAGIDEECKRRLEINDKPKAVRHPQEEQHGK